MSDTMTSPFTELQSNTPEKMESGAIIYPDSDGKPMADNTQQFEWITTIKGNLDSIFKDKADVFVAGDLLWYPEEGFPNIRVAPDVMVAFGRPKGHRGSYQQWKEGNIPPQVVFEILSPGNTALEMIRKERFYAEHGVQEYYVYDPQVNSLLISKRNEQQELKDLKFPEGKVEWLSPLLGVKFLLEEGETLKIFDSSGKPFLTYVERAQSEQEAWQAFEEERKAKEEERKARVSAEQEEEKALSEKEVEIAKLKELMKQAGLDID